ncbi:hypothetical protein Hanom_Chr14g01302831 [Helianthus anomalus]
MVALFGMWQWLKLVVVSDGRPDGPAPAAGTVTARVQAADLFISEVLSITVNYCDKVCTSILDFLHFDHKLHQLC